MDLKLDAPRLLSDFIAAIRSAESPSILEIGTKRSNPEVSTVHREWYPEGSELVLSDFEDGMDVDVVADIHNLSDVFGQERFDFIVASSVLEHVQRPWIAIPEVFKTMKPGGQAFIQTHQAFPIHGYPSDFWRFTTEALDTLFADAGFEISGSAYEFPCNIYSTVGGTHQAPAFLNVVIVGRRPA